MAKKEDLNNPNKISMPNFSNNLDTQKYLYETGLQNIFDDYQRQISNLDINKQRDIEEAYYTRELAKKYLGDYASNTGVGDVSGQLLDIYGKYQSNLSDINKYYGELEQGFKNQYGQKKQEYTFGLAQTNAQINQLEEAKRQEQLEKERLNRVAEANYNISTGILPEGMNMEQYLGSIREDIGDNAYWELMGKNKLVEMNKETNNALNRTSDFKTQEEWDKHIGSLLSSNKINQQQFEYLKSMYNVEESTNFKIIMPQEVSEFEYEIPTNYQENIPENAKKFASRNKENILIQSNVEVSSFSSLFKDLEEASKEIGFNIPFGYGSKFFVKEIKDGDIVYNEYYVIPNKKKKKEEVKKEEPKKEEKPKSTVKNRPYDEDMQKYPEWLKQFNKIGSTI